MKGDETLAAIAAAHAVFHSWSRMTAKERGAILRRWVGQQGGLGGVAQVTSVTWCPAAASNTATQPATAPEAAADTVDYPDRMHLYVLWMDKLQLVALYRVLWVPS